MEAPRRMNGIGRAKNRRETDAAMRRTIGRRPGPEPGSAASCMAALTLFHFISLLAKSFCFFPDRIVPARLSEPLQTCSAFASAGDSLALRLDSSHSVGRTDNLYCQSNNFVESILGPVFHSAAAMLRPASRAHVTRKRLRVRDEMKSTRASKLELVCRAGKWARLRTRALIRVRVFARFALTK